MSLFDCLLDVLRTFRLLGVNAVITGTLPKLFINYPTAEINRKLDSVRICDIMLFYHTVIVDDVELKAIFPSFEPEFNIYRRKYIEYVGYIWVGNIKIQLRKWKNKDTCNTFYIKSGPDCWVINDILKLFLTPSNKEMETAVVLAIGENKILLPVMASYGPTRSSKKHTRKRDVYHFEKGYCSHIGYPKTLGIIDCRKHFATRGDKYVSVWGNLEKIHIAGLEREAFQAGNSQWRDYIY